MQTSALVPSSCLNHSALNARKKRKRPKTTGVVVRPLISKEYSSRGQVDLIDTQSMSRNGFRWIMVYQDHLTKFCVLRAIKSKWPVEVAGQLLDIFLLFGAPAILQSDNATEFTVRVISELNEFWPRLVMVHGKPRHPQSQGSVERANGDIKDMLVAWLAASATTSAASATTSAASATTSAMCATVTAESSSNDITLLRLTERSDGIKRARKEAHLGQMSQAEWMVKRSRVDFKCGEIGDNVAVPVPMVDRGRGDARNILGVIVNREIDTDIYTIAVKSGVLKGEYSRNQFDLCPQRLLSMADVNLEKHVSLQSAVIEESASGGQGFVQCNCEGAVKMCQTNKCKCFKAKLLCNSRCHGSLSCHNK